MNRVILSLLAVLLTASIWAEAPPPGVAFDITKADIDLLLKNAPPAVDQQIRVVKPSANVNVMNGPGGNGTAGPPPVAAEESAPSGKVEGDLS
jgi:hypothetical protein